MGGDVRRIALLSLLPLTLFAGCLCGVPPELAFCSEDAECTSAERCVDGLCVGASTDVDGCTPRSECPAELCGTFDAGCGVALTCRCADGTQCGGGGVPNVCGVCDPALVDPPDDNFLDTNCDGIDGTADASVFVSPAGSDVAGDGSLNAPFRTLSFALTQAGNRPLLLDQGDYLEDGVVIRSQSSVHGGYRADGGWSRSVAAATTLRVNATGLVVDGVDGSVVLDRVFVVGDDSDGGAGGLAVGLFVQGSSSVFVRNAVIEAGRGAKGAAGGEGARGADGADGGAGSPGSAGGAGGPPGLNPECPSANGGAGGAGAVGDDFVNQNPGAPGGPNGDGTLAGGAGGAAVCNTCACRNGDGGMGLSGAAAGQAAAGGGGAGFGAVFGEDGGFYVAPIAEGGQNGVAGQGGSAGGGGASGFVALTGACVTGTTPTGGGGAGAGAGGCGGEGGAGGTGGGPSIAIVILNSAVAVEASTLITRGGGNGGEGGRGGVGGFGGRGGTGGDGGTANGATAGNGGAGGNGGRGGTGGAGGGGVGGYSIGVYCDGATLQLLDAGTQLGPRGSGGVSLGIAGGDGQVAATLGGCL